MYPRNAFDVILRYLQQQWTLNSRLIGVDKLNHQLVLPSLNRFGNLCLLALDQSDPQPQILQ